MRKGTQTVWIWHKMNLVAYHPVNLMQVLYIRVKINYFAIQRPGFGSRSNLSSKYSKLRYQDTAITDQETFSACLISLRKSITADKEMAYQLLTDTFRIPRQNHARLTKIYFYTWLNIKAAHYAKRLLYSHLRCRFSLVWTEASLKYLSRRLVMMTRFRQRYFLSNFQIVYLCRSPLHVSSDSGTPSAGRFLEQYTHHKRFSIAAVKHPS